MSLIVFSHANSFPASTYALLFSLLRERGFTVRALDKFGHDPAYPVTSNWPHLVRQLADFAGREAEQHAQGEGIWLVGHSLGGFLSLMCAARHPVLGGQPVKGVVLIDSPVLGGWRARTLEVFKRTRLVKAVSPGKISRKRRHQWPDAQSAFEHFARKPSFARWEPQVLRDYVDNGTRETATPQGSLRVLDFEREIETAIYNTLPHNLDRLLRRHPLRCPVGFIGGTESVEMRQVGMGMTQRLVGRNHPERMVMIEGSHLFPMEQPLQTATAIETVLRQLSLATQALAPSTPPATHPTAGR